MPITQQINSKANIKKFTNQDVPFSSNQPVLSSYYATSTAAQTSIANLGFSVSTLTTGSTDNFWLFVDGKKLTLSQDYSFAAIASDGSSSAITLLQPLALGLNIQAYKMGLTSQSDIGFSTDNRFTAAYEYLDKSFQGWTSQTALITPTTTTGTPVAGTFYSTIPNRASMVDMSQDLKVNMGIQRFATQQVYDIPTESGPNGERVWGVLNDTLGQVRLVGTWRSFVDSAAGQYINSAIVSDYFEITFYGTGLNILASIVSVNQDVRVSIDGGTEGANIYPSTTTNGTVLTTRFVALNQVLSAASGLTPGIHTAKVRIVGGVSSPNFNGYEILNESSTLKTNPGTGYIQGKKSVLSALNSQAFSSVFDSGTLGTRGGRVVVYQKADGTIGKAVTPTNASSATIASTDHTNEEVVRIYNFREFGAGRQSAADDFSTASVAASNRSFTLDDGTTTLNMVQSAIDASGVGGKEGIVVAQAATSAITFTFVGTGLDFLNVTNGSPGAPLPSLFIDGTTIATNTNGFIGPGWNKVVSGLPYGTHVVRISQASGGAGIRFSDFKVYQPKKPAIPAGAIELADYNIMATYAAGSIQQVDNIGTGLLRKMNIREWAFVNTFTASSVDPVNYISGFETFTSTSGASQEIIFFGTGFELRGRANTGWSATNTVSLQSLSTGGTLNTLNSTNFPGLTTSSLGGFTFTYASGNLSLATTSALGAGMAVSGLTLGMYKLRITSGTANNFSIDAIDIITPIHSIKSNLFGDLQNTLPVGSNALSDNRKTTPSKDVLPSQKAWAQAAGITSGPSTTSSAMVPVPDLSTTIKTTGGPIEVNWSISVNDSTTSVTTVYQIYVDGVGITPDVGGGTTVTFSTIFSQTLIIPVSAGTHKVDLYWGNGGTGTLSASGVRRSINVREI